MIASTNVSLLHCVFLCSLFELCIVGAGACCKEVAVACFEAGGTQPDIRYCQLAAGNPCPLPCLDALCVYILILCIILSPVHQAQPGKINAAEKPKQIFWNQKFFRKHRSEVVRKTVRSFEVTQIFCDEDRAAAGITHSSSWILEDSPPF